MDLDLKASDLLADLFSGVADDDGELHAMLVAPRTGSGLSDSSASSLASSPLPPLRFNDTTSDLVGEVKAYCRFTHELVRVRFPTDSNGWLYRVDLGGTSQHRWDHSGILNMVVRHSTCMKAVLPRSICRNCNMKEYWRVKCGDHDDTFFIMCEHTVSLEAATQILRHVQIGQAIPITDADIHLYENAQVSLFNVSPRKRPIDFDEKRCRMETLRLQLCTAVPRPPMALADELEMRTNNELIDMLAPLGCTPTALLPGSPVRAVHHSPPPSVLLPVYQRLLSAILVQSGNIRSVDRVELQNMMVRISQSTRAAIVPSDDLGRLFMQLGVPLSASLYLKPSVIAWLTSTSSLPEDVVSFQLGFYVAPTCHIYEMIKADDQLPLFVTNAKHGLAQNYQVALHSAKQRAGVRPVLMIIPVQQNEKGPLFHGSNMLVLGSVGSGGE